MSDDDLPPSKPRPRVGFTWWWAAGLAVAVAAAVAFAPRDARKHDPAGLNTVEMTHAPPG